MRHGRKKIICKKCNKERLNYGFGLCSACSRVHKRQTRPSFYLGTCYSEISRRCNTFDPKRPKYKGRQKCTKEEFINRFVTDETFLSLYRNWQQQGFQRKFAPSIDRINNEKDYTIDNLQFIVLGLNSKKDWQYNIIVTNLDQSLTFESQKATAKFFNVCPTVICRLFQEGDSAEYNGWLLRRSNV